MRRFLVYEDPARLADELKRKKYSEGSREPALAPGLPDATPGLGGADPLGTDRLTFVSRQAELKLLLETLETVRWNRRQAAARLNVDYKALLYKLQKHGIVENKSKRKDGEAVLPQSRERFSGR